MINETKQFIFSLMEKGSFNEFNGTKVVKDLRDNEHLWQRVIMCRPIDTFLPLRDIGKGVWNVDTLAILSSGKNDKQLEKIARSWKPSTLEWVCHEKAARLLMKFWPDQDKILYLWWD